MHPLHRKFLHENYGDGRSFGDKLADRFVARFGSWSYIIWQTVAVALWVTGNIFVFPLLMASPPDPYPFILLNLFFSTQASYAAPLILMAQNRAAVRDKEFASHQFEIISEIHKLTGEVHRTICGKDGP